MRNPPNQSSEGCGLDTCIMLGFSMKQYGVLWLLLCFYSCWNTEQNQPTFLSHCQFSPMRTSWKRHCEEALVSVRNGSFGWGVQIQVHRRERTLEHSLSYLPTCRLQFAPSRSSIPPTWAHGCGKAFRHLEWWPQYCCSRVPNGCNRQLLFLQILFRERYMARDWSTTPKWQYINIPCVFLGVGGNLCRFLFTSHSYLPFI